MRPTPWTWGCATVAAVLGVIGLFLDSPAATGVAVGLTLLLCGQAAIFLYRTVRYADGLHVERVIEEETVWQGTPMRVLTRVKAPAAPGLQTRLIDLPPRTSIYDPQGTVLFHGERRYWIRFAAPGEVFFRGLQIDAANLFFSTTILGLASRFAGAGLTVYPAANREMKATAPERWNMTVRGHAGVRGSVHFVHSTWGTIRLCWTGSSRRSMVGPSFVSRRPKPVTRHS